MTEPHSDCPHCKLKLRFRSFLSVGGGYDDLQFPPDEACLGEQAARECASALNRALDAMRRADLKYAKREVEDVVEQIALAGVR